MRSRHRRWHFATFGLALALGSCQLLLETGSDKQQARNAPDASSSDAMSDGPADTASTADSGPQGLVAHWPFDTTAGTLTKDVVGGHHGTFASPPTWLTDGKRGGCVRLDGQHAMNVSSLEGVAFPRTGTLSMWLRSDYPPGDRAIFGHVLFRQHMFLRAYGDAGMQAAGEWLPDSGHTEPYAWVITFSVPRAVWHHVALTWEEAPAGRIVAYLDGVELGRASTGPDWTPDDQEFVVGARGCCGSFVGDIDELRLFSRALKDEEIVALASP